MAYTPMTLGRYFAEEERAVVTGCLLPVHSLTVDEFSADTITHMGDVAKKSLFTQRVVKRNAGSAEGNNPVSHSKTGGVTGFMRWRNRQRQTR